MSSSQALDLDAALDLFLRDDPVLRIKSGPREIPDQSRAADDDHTRGINPEDDHDSGNDSISELTDQDMPELIRITQPTEQAIATSTGIAGEVPIDARDDSPRESNASASNTGLQTNIPLQESSMRPAGLKSGVLAQEGFLNHCKCED